MSILFFGDPHGEFDHIIRIVMEKRPASIVLMGDMEAPKPLDELLGEIIEITDIYWIHGNHDVDRKEFHTNLFQSGLAGHCLNGRVVEVNAGDGKTVRIAGLGGVFEKEVWLPPEQEKFVTRADFDQDLQQQQDWRLISREKADGLRLKADGAIFYDEWFNLHGQTADILVTHDAPGCHPNGNAAIDALAIGMGVERVFHGHHHDNLDYPSGIAPYVVHGVGLRGVTDLTGAPVLRGENDIARKSRMRPAL